MRTFKFKQEHPLEKRKELSNKIYSSYPDRTPIIVECDPRTGKPTINKCKFLVPSEITLSKFLVEIRKHIPNVSPNDALYLLNENGSAPRTTEIVSLIAERYKDEDGFLYLYCCEENVFGGYIIHAPDTQIKSQ